MLEIVDRVLEQFKLAERHEGDAVAPVVGRMHGSAVGVRGSRCHDAAARWRWRYLALGSLALWSGDIENMRITVSTLTISYAEKGTLVCRYCRIIGTFV